MSAMWWRSGATCRCVKRRGAALPAGRSGVGCGAPGASGARSAGGMGPRAGCARSSWRAGLAYDGEGEAHIGWLLGERAPVGSRGAQVLLE